MKKNIILIFLIFLSISQLALASPLAYITNSGHNNVFVIDTLTNEIVNASAAIGLNPTGVVVHPNRTKVYVANTGDNSVAVLNSMVEGIATIPVGNSPYGIAIHPNGTKVYVANQQSNSLSVIDTETNTVTATVSVGSSPIGIASNPDGTFVFVSNEGENTVSVVDSANLTVTASIQVGAGPTGIIISPDGTTMYVTNSLSDTVSAINIPSMKLVETIRVGSKPKGIAANIYGTMLYVANEGDNSVSIINTSTLSVTDTVMVGNRPIGIGVEPYGEYVYVANSGSNTVSIIDTSNNMVVRTLNVAETPTAFGQFIARPDHTLAVTMSGTGTGSIVGKPSKRILCGQICGADYMPGQTVTLKAYASVDSVFSRWTGDCSGTKATCKLTIVPQGTYMRVNAVFISEPTAHVRPTNKNFRNIMIGKEKISKFTIQNTEDKGIWPLQFGTLYISGDVSQFRIIEDNCSANTLTHMGKCSLKVAFIPIREGSTSAKLNIPSNDPDSPKIIDLLGNGKK